MSERDDIKYTTEDSTENSLYAFLSERGMKPSAATLEYIEYLSRGFGSIFEPPPSPLITYQRMMSWMRGKTSMSRLTANASFLDTCSSVAVLILWLPASPSDRIFGLLPAGTIAAFE